MIPLSPSLLIAGASTLIGTGVEAGASRGPLSRGRLLDLMAARVGLPRLGPWSTAFVHHVGYWSHYDFRTRSSSWPLPPIPRPEELADYSSVQGIFVDEPQPGDVFLHWSPPRKRLIRTGIVAWVEDRRVYPGTGRHYYVCTTIEGETTELGRPGGTGVHVLRRNLSVDGGDRFLRWADLDHPAVCTPFDAEIRHAAERITGRAA